MAEKKYYWLKLQKDFFKRHDIRIIEAMKNGKDYILFYLKLLVESVSHEGELRFSETIPYNEEMLATVTDTNVDVVRAAMQAFIGLGMIEILEDKTIFMCEVDKMIGSTVRDDHAREADRERQRRCRERKKLKDVTLLSCDGHVTCHGELEKELEIDKELEIEIDGIPGDNHVTTDGSQKKASKHTYGEYRHVFLTDEERDKLIDQFGEGGFSERVRRLDEYIQMKHKTYHDHYLTILNWARKDAEQAKQREGVSLNQRVENIIANERRKNNNGADINAADHSEEAEFGSFFAQ